MTKNDGIIVISIKPRTTDPLPNGSHEHHQWQGEAGDEDDDNIITDIIGQQMNIKSKGEGFDTDRDNVLVTRTITKETFRITIPENIVPGASLGGGTCAFVVPKIPSPENNCKLNSPS
jgi:hypothetical protein